MSLLDSCCSCEEIVWETRLGLCPSMCGMGCALPARPDGTLGYAPRMVHSPEIIGCQLSVGRSHYRTSDGIAANGSFTQSLRRVDRSGPSKYDPLTCTTSTTLMVKSNL